MAKALSKDEILETIDQMTVLDLSDLVKAFEERYGVTAAAPVAVAVAPADRFRPSDGAICALVAGKSAKIAGPAVFWNVPLTRKLYGSG